MRLEYVYNELCLDLHMPAENTVRCSLSHSLASRLGTDGWLWLDGSWRRQRHAGQPIRLFSECRGTSFLANASWPRVWQALVIRRLISANRFNEPVRKTDSVVPLRSYVVPSGSLKVVNLLLKPCNCFVNYKTASRFNKMLLRPTLQAC